MTLGPAHVDAFLATGNEEVQHEDFGMPEDEFVDLLDDVQDRVRTSMVSEVYSDLTQINCHRWNIGLMMAVSVPLPLERIGGCC